QTARLQLQQRSDQDEELAAGFEVELAALREPLAERDHDPRDVDLGEVELLLQDQRQEQVERPLERVEVELQLAYFHPRQANATAGRGPSGSPSPAPRARDGATACRAPLRRPG